MSRPPALSFLMTNTKSLRSGSCFGPTPKCPLGNVVLVFPPYSHSAVRDAHLLLLDTASVQRENAVAPVLWEAPHPPTLGGWSYKRLHASQKMIGLHPDVVSICFICEMLDPGELNMSELSKLAKLTFPTIPHDGDADVWTCAQQEWPVSAGDHGLTPPAPHSNL